MRDGIERPVPSRTGHLPRRYDMEPIIQPRDCRDDDALDLDSIALATFVGMSAAAMMVGAEPS
jgi:hypothetical protein